MDMAAILFLAFGSLGALCIRYQDTAMVARRTPWASSLLGGLVIGGIVAGLFVAFAGR